VRVENGVPHAIHTVYAWIIVFLRNRLRKLVSVPVHVASGMV